MSQKINIDYSMPPINKKYILFGAIALVALLLMYVSIKSKSKHDMIDDIDLDDMENDHDSTDGDSISLVDDSHKYDLYHEIKQFMDRQTNYVMNV